MSAMGEYRVSARLLIHEYDSENGAVVDAKSCLFFPSRCLSVQGNWNSRESTPGRGGCICMLRNIM